MATTQSSSPFHSPQDTSQRIAKPAPAQTTSLVEQQLRLSVERHNCSQRSRFFFPWPKKSIGG